MAVRSELEIRALTAKAAQNDESAWNTLVNDHHEALVRYVKIRLDTRLACRVDAEDIVQNAWTAAFRRLDKFHESDLQFKTWLYIQTKDALLEVIRHNSRQMRDYKMPPIAPGSGSSSVHLANMLYADITSPSQAVIRAENINQLMEAYDSLPDADKHVLCLVCFEKLERSEIARLLDIEYNACVKRISRAMRKLKEALDDDGFSGITVR